MTRSASQDLTPPETAAEFAQITRRYLHMTPTPCYVDGEGRIWLERTWYLDFVQHLSYLRNWVNCAPKLPFDPKVDLVRLQVERDTPVTFVHLPPQTSYLQALLNLPRTAWILWKEVGRAEIVQSSVGGWPYPLGWIVNPAAWLRGKKLIINVESDWWLTGPGRDRWWNRLANLDPVRHWMGKWSCDRADLTLFTHSTYRDRLSTRHRERSFVTPAVWIDQADVLDARTAEESWERKAREPVRFLLAGRFILAKGVAVLLEALRSLDARGIVAHVDTSGSGDELPALRKAASELRHVRLTNLDPVPYGKAIFERIRNYHAVLVPSLTQEQPRIVFDAYVQGVPVIASDTDGIRPYVTNEKTGWLLPPGDVKALATAIERANGSVPELRAMGIAGLEASRGFTHQAMHRWRSNLIRKYCS